MKSSTRSAPHKVYRCFDADERLIYVGMTSLSLEARFRVHARHNPQVAADTARIEVTEYPDRAEAAEAESRAIDFERPTYNIRRGAAWEPSDEEMRAAALLVFGGAAVCTSRLRRRGGLHFSSSEARR